MICAGMNVARFNFSHGTHEDHARRLAQLQKLRDELDMPVAALLHTKKRPPKGPPEKPEGFSGKPEKGLTKKSQPWYNKMLPCPCEELANSPMVQKQCSIRDKKRQEAWK